MGRVADPSRMSGFTAPHCGSLRASDDGRELELYGWVARRRDHGGLIFIDLRDRWGAVQVVFNPTNAPEAHSIASQLRAEFVIRVKGVVVRRPRMQQMLELRHRVVQAMHRYMDANEFVEVETPMLLKGTPEGSRDFLVPSRLHPGSFFALPQSPQQLKQLLMVAGTARYYQIARCLRDEDLRADRVVEITQLDVEMSFCSEEDVFALIEGLWVKVWKEVLGIEIQTPLSRLDMQESLLRYGTDKPD